LHLFALVPAPHLRDSERIGVVRPGDSDRGAPHFRAPALPTPRQLGSELPFSVNFGLNRKCS
jgi:hypothetical protein